MIYRPAHIVDRQSGAIIAAEVRPGDAGDTASHWSPKRPGHPPQKDFSPPRDLVVFFDNLLGHRAYQKRSLQATVILQEWSP
jgi:hypothetical protein